MLLFFFKKANFEGNECFPTTFVRKTSCLGQHPIREDVNQPLHHHSCLVRFCTIVLPDIVHLTWSSPGSASWQGTFCPPATRLKWFGLPLARRENGPNFCPLPWRKQDTIIFSWDMACLWDQLVWGSLARGIYNFLPVEDMASQSKPIFIIDRHRLLYQGSGFLCSSLPFLYLTTVFWLVTFCRHKIWDGVEFRTFLVMILQEDFLIGMPCSRSPVACTCQSHCS